LGFLIFLMVYLFFLAILTKAIHEQQSFIEKLEKRIAELESLN